MINVDCLIEVQERVRAKVPDALVSILPADGGQVRLTAVSGYVWAVWGVAPVALQRNPERTADELGSRLMQRLSDAAKRGNRE